MESEREGTDSRRDEKVGWLMEEDVWDGEEEEEEKRKDEEKRARGALSVTVRLGQRGCTVINASDWQ